MGYEQPKPHPMLPIHRLQINFGIKQEIAKSNAAGWLAIELPHRDSSATRFVISQVGNSVDELLRRQHEVESHPSRLNAPWQRRIARIEWKPHGLPNVSCEMMMLDQRPRNGRIDNPAGESNRPICDVK